MMFSFLKRFFHAKPKPNPEMYESERETMKGGSKPERMALATSENTHLEILYYLAEQDPDPEVRMAAATNDSTPLQASTFLAVDSDVDVRMALAGRLLKLLPDLDKKKQAKLYAFAVQALSTLALDEVLKIRIALSSTLKDYAFTPPNIAGQLAKDVERQVSEPILRFCATVPDEDLLLILKNHPESWVAQAIAARESVSAPVSTAVIETEDIPAGQILLENKGAEITEDLLEEVVRRAQECPEWHAPIALHKKLTPSLARALAQFIDVSVRHLLALREDFTPDVVDEISAIMKRRMDYMEDDPIDGATAEERVKSMKEKGELTDEAITDALGMRDIEFVVAALTELTGADKKNIEKVADMRAPKGITAVAWKAGLSMRTAFTLQKELCRVPHQELLYPKDGTDYPLSKEDLEWQLDFLDIA